MPFSFTDLPLLERPARYLGTEIGASPNTRPDSSGHLLKIALAFPDVYEIAHSHLGHKILYALFNQTPGFSAERAYAPWLDLEKLLRTKNQPLLSLETKRPLKDFDVVGFSLQYELGYTNILNMLDLAKIPLNAADRGQNYPLIVAGGPGCANPEPLADFLDIFFLGDAEAFLLEDYQIIKEWRFSGAPKSELFSQLAPREGIYIPALYEPQYGPPKNSHPGEFLGIVPIDPSLPFPRSALVTELSGAFFPSCQIVPFVKPVHDRVAVEIARGCSRGCRFCQAGYLYRPVRERKTQEIIHLIRQNLEFTGLDEAAFLSLSAGDHTEINPLVETFMNQTQGVSLSLPSLRVRSLNRELASQIKRVRKTGFTLAPEAGTARLRAVINKDLTEDDILEAVNIAFSLGWRTLKLYFMCGLPTETEEDLLGIRAMVKKIKKSTKAKLNLGLAHFTPKAHTPFQWERASDPGEIQKRFTFLKKELNIAGVLFKHGDPGASAVEAILARGDRRLGKALASVFSQGGRFEAWNDHFHLSHWEQAFASQGLSPRNYLEEKDTAAPLPWDHLSYGIKKEFLLKEREKAYQEIPTPDCRDTSCQKCGACRGGAKIQLARPKIDSPKIDSPKIDSSPPFTTKSPLESPSQTTLSSGDFKYLIHFQKKDQAIFLGHLEMIDVFKRAFRRAGLPLAMSAGFHPLPRLSFLTALPLGVISLDECLLFSLTQDIPPQEIQKTVILPQGLTFSSVARHEATKLQLLGTQWILRSPTPAFQSPPLFPSALVSYTNNKGRVKSYNLRDYVLDYQIVDPTLLWLSLLHSSEGSPKAPQAARALWNLPPEWPFELSKNKTLLKN
ncbi:MAG: TIGR03960 family B12-binding radical SAM protein [Deltaproteobacteria bacterium]|nr:TIGR03960 family B12-binding radical SAM protein [Deltaproteobacteria bacterium]